MPITLRRLTHNWRLKLLALGLSVFLWALVQNEPNAETFTAPVRVAVKDTAWTAAGSPTPATVEIKLGGPGGEMGRFVRQGPVVRVPVESVGSRDTTITLRREWVDLGEGTRLNVEDISPSAVRVSFERAVTRVVPAAVRLQGRLDTHLALAGPISVNPRMVHVHGARSRVESLDSVPLRPLDLSVVNASGVFTVAVDTTVLAGVQVSPHTAALMLQVEDQIERVLPAVPIEVDSQAVGVPFVVEPSAVRVTLSGAKTPVTAVDPSKLVVRIDSDELRGMTPGEVRRVPLRVEGVSGLVTAVPDQEMVTVRRPATGRRGGGPYGSPGGT